ncbi:putative alkaline phosphatase, alkaline-phosphatase-like, core domain superfamily [Septoria linicola]|nr:putative alkaline phosphatase, alkaline-phosphatase-like, core domain superfamily [Septoria linicola]
MAQPVLQRPGSVNSSERGIEEEDALLTGQKTGKTENAAAVVRNRWREIGLFVWAMVATTVVVVLALLWQHNSQSAPHDSDDGSSSGGGFKGKRNLIFMVSDGMGPTSLALTRSWRQYTDNLPFSSTLGIDQHLIGQSRTRSSSSLVTDSAAGATAFSCGHKSYNGAISVLPDFEPCGSVMEAAKRMGYTTGLVVTTRITDATPAVFASHVRRREMEDEIALQMLGETHPLGRMVDLMIGGGRCHFLPNTTEGGCRADDVDAISLAKDKGWQYLETRKDFDGLGDTAELPLLTLLAPTDIPYEIDRRQQEDVYPSLEETAKKALDILAAATKNSEKGFFIMIEGSRIDHAGHANDPAAQVHEVLAYDKAMKAVLDFIDHSDVPTLMISTSDHETGGLATARQLHEAYPDYLWYPGVLANASHSASHTSHEWYSHLTAKSGSNQDHTASEDDRAFLDNLVRSSLGIHDATTSELDSLLQQEHPASYIFADMVSRRAQTGWSTHGHSGADVNIYTSDPIAAKKLRGNHENTEVGEFLRDYLGAGDEVEKVTALLQKHAHKSAGAHVEFLGEVPEEGERLDGQDHLDGYHGDHKTRRGKRCDVCGV